MSSQLATLALRDARGHLIAVIDGEIDMSNADDLSRSISARLTAEHSGLVLDLSGVTYLDSAAIHVIYELRERLAQRTFAFRLVVPAQAPTMMALRLTGVPEAVPVFPDVDAALAA